jgi:hypothetical protein
MWLPFWLTNEVFRYLVRPMHGEVRDHILDRLASQLKGKGVSVAKELQTSRPRGCTCFIHPVRCPFRSARGFEGQRGPSFVMSLHLSLQT